MTVYWHGGAPGLAAGDWLEPRSASEVWRPDNMLCVLKDAGRGPSWVAEEGVVITDAATDLVYVTASRTLAAQFAQGYTMWLAAIGAPGGGCLYRVEPDGPLQPDPRSDAADGAYTAARARITAVEVQAMPFPDTPPYRLAVRKLRECYEVWREEFNGGADRWP